MKHVTVRPHRRPIAWGDFEYAARLDHGADDLEHRVREQDLDSEDEHVAVEGILHKMIHGVN